jgi:hypothetical protein
MLRFLYGSFSRLTGAKIHREGAKSLKTFATLRFDSCQRWKRSRLWLLAALALTLSACGPREPEPTPTPSPTATPIPTPTLTPTPTRVPREACPSPDPNAAWAAPAEFSGYTAAIGGFLNAGGSADTLRTFLSNASSISAQFGGVWSFDLTGDGDAETIVSIYDPLGRVFGPVPDGMLLIYGCLERAALLLYQDAGQPMLLVERIDDFIGAGRGGELMTNRSECGAHTCFDTLDVLGWDGAQFVSLMGGQLQMPSPDYTLTNLDDDGAQEIRAVSGMIASVGAGPQRIFTETWDWNGAQYVKVNEVVSPPAYRIHLVHDADDRLRQGHLTEAIELYNQVITDEALKDWLLELGVAKPQDRANLTAYAWYRMMLANVRLGDAGAAQAAFDRLSADFPAGAPGDAYRALAQVFWSSYQETGDLSAACLAANRLANDDTDAIDGLNAFGYANRQYVAADMCPFVGG